jgi:hypothetical protein
MGDNDDYRMAIFSGRLEDWAAWKHDIESFLSVTFYGHSKNPIKFFKSFILNFFEIAS